jgi:formamidopyrimidine-DNA glycosylase
MPEGPEVKITADGLKAEILNHKLSRIVFNEASRYHSVAQKGNFKNQNNIRFPMKISDVYSKGKKIIIVAYDDYDRPIVFISALGMEGSWKLYPGKHSGIELHFTEYTYYDHLKSPIGIKYESKILYFHDTRHFGTFDICMNQNEIDFVLKSVGPDLLNDDVSFEQYDEVITQERIYHKEICWFMMEQKFFSGVGNYLLAEILYACRILPTRLLRDLTAEDIYNLWFNSRKLIRESYESGGLTIATYFSMKGEKGIFDTKVYGKSRDPLGNPVYTGTFSNGRTSHYVPGVQI